MAIWRMRIACWIHNTHTHTHRLYNTHCFSTVTMVARTRLIVRLHVHCLSCFFRCHKFTLLYQILASFSEKCKQLYWSLREIFWVHNKKRDCGHLVHRIWNYNISIWAACWRMKCMLITFVLKTIRKKAFGIKCSGLSFTSRTFTCNKQRFC